MLAGDEQYHPDEDERNSCPEENAHDSARHQPVVTNKTTPQRVVDCAAQEHANIIRHCSRFHRPAWATSSATSSANQPPCSSNQNWIVQCFTSPPTQYRSYGRRFLQVKRPNQQYQSTEGKRKKQRTKTTKYTYGQTIIDTKKDICSRNRPSSPPSLSSSEVL